VATYVKLYKQIRIFLNQAFYKFQVAKFFNFFRYLKINIKISDYGNMKFFYMFELILGECKQDPDPVFKTLIR